MIATGRGVKCCSTAGRMMDDLLATTGEISPTAVQSETQSCYCKVLSF